MIIEIIATVVLSVFLCIFLSIRYTFFGSLDDAFLFFFIFKSLFFGVFCQKTPYRNHP